MASKGGYLKRAVAIFYLYTKKTECLVPYKKRSKLSSEENVYDVALKSSYLT